jgi:small subunit ribosomal protein S3Ae
MAKTLARTKAKKKQWYSIIAPARFDGQHVGEAHVTNPNDLVGRRLKVSMRDVTNNRRAQHIDLDLEVHKVAEDRAQTFVRGFSISPSTVKRYVRRGRTRIDDSFVARTSEDYRLRIKPIIVTHGTTVNNVQKKIRKATKQRLQKLCKNNTYDDVLDAILGFDIQKELKEDLSKLYPIRTLEIRVFRLLDNVVPDGRPVPETEEDESDDETADEAADDEAADEASAEPSGDETSEASEESSSDTDDEAAEDTTSDEAADDDSTKN